MLTKALLEAGAEAASALVTHSNVAVCPNPDSELHHLVQHTMPITFSENLSGEVYRAEALGRCGKEYPRDLEAYTMKLRGRVIALQNFIKTVVNPMMREAHDAVIAALDAHSRSSGELFSIKMVPRNAIAFDTVVESLVDKFRGGRFAKAVTAPITTDLPTLVATLGLANETKSLVQMALDDPRHAESLKMIFSGGAVLDPTANTQSIETLVAATIIFSALMPMDPLPGVSMTLGDYVEYLGRMRGLTGHLAVTKIDVTRRKDLSTGLITTAEVGEKVDSSVIYVREKAYLEGVERGLTPELLYGNRLTGSKYNSADDIIANREHLNRVYREAVNRHELANRTQSGQVLVLALSQKLHAMVRESEHIPAESKPQYYAYITRWIKENVHPESSVPKTPWVLCKNAVLNVFFGSEKSIAVRQFVDCMETVSCKMPEVTSPEEIAQLATIRYIAMWAVFTGMVNINIR